MMPAAEHMGCKVPKPHTEVRGNVASSGSDQACKVVVEAPSKQARNDLDGKCAQSSTQLRAQGAGGYLVGDVRVTSKNSFLHVTSYETAPQSSSVRSCSAPAPESDKSEKSASSSSSRNTAQKKMMDHSSDSSGSRPLSLRGPPKGTPEAEISSCNESSLKNPDFSTSSNNTFESDIIDDYSGEHQVAETPPAPAPAAPAAPAGAPNAGGADVVSRVPENRNRRTQLPSVGSAGHATGNCRPCIFISRTSLCRAGRQCRYCHLPHTTATAGSSRKTRPCKEKRERQKRAMERVYGVFEEDPEAFDVESFEIPPSVQNTSLEGELRAELRRRKAISRAQHRDTGASSSSSWVPYAPTDSSPVPPRGTRMSL